MKQRAATENVQYIAISRELRCCNPTPTYFNRSFLAYAPQIARNFTFTLIAWLERMENLAGRLCAWQPTFRASTLEARTTNLITDIDTRNSDRSSALDHKVPS